MEEQIHLVKGSIEIDDRLLFGPRIFDKMAHSGRKAGTSNGTCRATIALSNYPFPRTETAKRRRGGPRQKIETDCPNEFGEKIKEYLIRSTPENLDEVGRCFAETAKAMPKRAPRERISQDPQIRDLIQQRVDLPRTPDGRQRFRITGEIRKLIRVEARKKRKAAVREAFAGHTNWAKVAQEMRIDRPLAAPIFKENGKSVTSDAEAMAAITRHVGAIYAEPEGPMQIPQWNTNHGRLALNLQEAVGIAASATQKKERLWMVPASRMRV